MERTIEFQKNLSLEETEKILEYLATKLPLNVYYQLRQSKKFVHNDIEKATLEIRSTHEYGAISYIDDLEEHFTFEFQTFGDNNELKYDAIKFFKLPPSDKLEKLEQTIKDYLSKLK